MEPPTVTVVNCNNACPVYNGELDEYMMPVKRVGLSKFLADTLIDNPSGLITPNLLVKRLSTFPDMGQVVYNRT